MDSSQKTVWLDAARGEQRRSDRAQPGYRVRPRLLCVSEHEYPDRASVAHSDARMDPDHLLGDPRLQLRFRACKGLTADADRPQFRNAETPIAPHDELEIPILVPVELHVELIARADDVPGRHRHVRRRREG